MTTKVLMLGPGEGVGGGIMALNEAVVPVLGRYVDLLYIPTVENRPLSESGRISARNVARVLSQYARFFNGLIRFRPQIIHLHTSRSIAWLKDTFFVLAGKACGCRVVLHMHGGGFLEIYYSSTHLMQKYTRWILNLADKVIEVAEDRGKRLTQIVPAQRIVVFRNCIDVASFALRQPGRVSVNTCVLFLGVVGPSKGTFDLLEAAARLKSRGCSLTFYIAGSEERAGDLARARARVQELDLVDMCYLPGMIRGASKSRLLEDCDLFALPSYQEALPMAVLEAMAAGLPVIATPVGGIPEVIRDGYNGYLVDPGDVEALAEKLNVLAGDPRRCEIMGQRSREIAERELDVNPYVERLVALYASITGS